MWISTKDWLEYVGKLSKLNDTAGKLMQSYVAKNGFADTQGIIDYAYGLITKYGEGSAALAAEMYDETAALSGMVLPPAEVAETAGRNDVAKAVQGTIKQSMNPNSLGGTVSRLVKQAGADTTLKNAKRDGAQFAWVPFGETCPFCLALASRGFQYISAKSLRNGHAEHIHANCDCAYTVRFDKDSGVKGYDPDKYLKMYEDAEGKTSKDKINAMRRAQYQDPKVREKINAQKRESYKLRKSLTNQGVGGIIETQKNDPERMRIPQIPASTITKKIENGEYSLNLTQQSYDKHIPGTKTFETYERSRNEKGLNTQSVLTISKEEAQEIINRQSGTGIIKPKRDGSPTDIEQITCNKVIGYYYQQGKRVPTNKAAIHHGKRGSHIVPIKGNHYD